MIGSVRSTVDPKRQRQSFLKLVYENGYHHGYYGREPWSYEDDEEALKRYRIGLRIGRREAAKA